MKKKVSQFGVPKQSFPPLPWQPGLNIGILPGTLGNLFCVRCEPTPVTGLGLMRYAKSSYLLVWWLLYGPRIGNSIGPYEDLLTTVKRRKMKWYGHVTRSSGLAKTVLKGTVQGGRRRGSQRKRWEDNIKEWTGLQWNITLRKAENREEWRKLVVKSPVVPQRSARLRDR